MASGLPVIAAKSGPTCEQIDDGVSGLLYNPDDQNHFIQTVLKLEDEMMRKRLSKQAYDIGQKYGWDKPSEQIVGLYKEVLEEHGRMQTSGIM